MSHLCCSFCFSLTMHSWFVSLSTPLVYPLKVCPGGTTWRWSLGLGHPYQGSRLILPSGLTFTVGRTSTLFCCTFFFLLHGINQRMRMNSFSFFIVYSYMVTKWLTFYPFFFISIICDLNFLNGSYSFAVIS